MDEDAGASAQLDLTSTYFESAPPGHGKHGYRRDRRPDCGPVVIARIGTPDGFPLAYEVLPGKTGDKSTVEDFLVKIKEQYGQAERIWIMDRGLPTGDSLATRRAAETAVRYLVGTPKGRLSKFEKAFLTKPWAQVRARVDGRLLAQDGEVSIHQRDDRIEAPICVAFLAYCLQVTRKQRLRAVAPGLTPRAALEKFSAIQMVDVHLPTTDGRTLLLSRSTEPEKDQPLLRQPLRLSLPEQPPPRISSSFDARTA